MIMRIEETDPQMANMRATAKRLRPEPQLDVDDMLENARKASDFLKALSHETRLAILCLLLQGEKTVSAIEAVLNLRQPAISQQLARLRADNLVKVRREGKSVYYSVARPEVIEVMGGLYRAFCRH